MGNSNLSKDKFLRKALDSPHQGPFNCVPASLFLSFNKMKEILSPIAHHESPNPSTLEKARPRVSDVYRNNMEYKTLDQNKQLQIQAIVNSLKKSRVVKVCKD